MPEEECEKEHATKLGPHENQAVPNVGCPQRVYERIGKRWFGGDDEMSLRFSLEDLSECQVPFRWQGSARELEEG